ncbi:MAG: cupin domain-containing protein [Aestuariivirgaceae bacterium]
MDLLSDILSRLKLTGTLYFRTSFTSPWSVKVPSFANVSRFHFAHRGRCFVRVKAESSPVLLEQGDLIIITAGAEHTLYCDSKTENLAVQLDEVVQDSGFTGSGTLVYGDHGTNHETQLVCGHFAFDENANHPLIDALPSYIHIKNYGEIAGSWMENTLKVIGAEACRDDMGSDLIGLKLSEIIFAQALRTYINSAGIDKPVLAGFSDPNIARTLEAIHKDPAFAWSLEALSSVAGMSRTSFVNRFTSCMSMTPLSYVTQWRMLIARQLLTETAEPIIGIAEDVGYRSEAAFGRVFKKHFAIAPATMRRQLRAAAQAHP